jgi:ABC-2 type transport system ATP-binding protein
MGTVVAVEGLHKEYADVKAVDGVSFSVGAGRLFGLIGPNGAGKTTTIKCLTGQIKPTKGKVIVLGVDVVLDPVGVRSLVGVIPEQEAPPSFLTSEEYLSFVCSIRGVMDAEGRLDKWFKLLDFEGQRNILCKDLSRGTRQKLMVAQAFIHEPKVVFIDEPLVNLDPIAQKVVKDYLKGYVGDGNTVFMSSHILEIVEEICDDVAIIGEGRILAKGTVKTVLHGRHLEDVFLKLVGESHVRAP